MAQKSYDPNHLLVATVFFVPAAAEGRVLFVAFSVFFFSFLSLPGAALYLLQEKVATLAESNSPGCFSYLCSISSSSWAVKFKCSVMLTPQGLSLYCQNNPSTEILLLGKT